MTKMTNKDSITHVKYDLKFLNKTNDRENIKRYLDDYYNGEHRSQEFIKYVMREAKLRHSNIIKRSNTIAVRIVTGSVQFVRSSPAQVLQFCLEWCEEVADSPNEIMQQATTCATIPSNHSATYTHDERITEGKNKNATFDGSIKKTDAIKSYNQTKTAKTHTSVFTANSPAFQGLNKYKLIEIAIFLFAGKDKNGTAFFEVNGKRTTQKSLIAFLRLFDVFNFTKDGKIKADSTLLDEIGLITTVKKQSKYQVNVLPHSNFLQATDGLYKYIVNTNFTKGFTNFDGLK